MYFVIALSLEYFNILLYDRNSHVFIQQSYFIDFSFPILNYIYNRNVVIDFLMRKMQIRTFVHSLIWTDGVQGVVETIGNKCMVMVYKKIMKLCCNRKFYLV